jgi:hypothetical protein
MEKPRTLKPRRIGLIVSLIVVALVVLAAYLRFKDA